MLEWSDLLALFNLQANSGGLQLQDPSYEAFVKLYATLQEINKGKGIEELELFLT